MTRRMLLFGLMIAFLVMAAASRASAQVTQIPLVKGQIYTVKLPGSVLTSGGVRAGWDEVYPVLLAEFSGLPSAMQIGGVSEWRTSGFPSMLQVKFEKVTVKKEYTDVEFRPAVRSDLDVKLRFHPGFDYRAVLGELIIPGPPTSPAAQSYVADTYKLLADKFFAGPLASIPDEKKRLLVSYAHVTANGTSLKSEVYKNNLYMVVDLGRDTSVYNDLRFTQSTRLAHVMNERLLMVLKAFAKPVEDISQIYGLKLVYQIPHRSFADQKAAAVNDLLEFYAPADLIKKFAEADITNQQFVDGCVAIVNENRVQVALAVTNGN